MAETLKYLEILFTDGVYRVPAHIIARDRATYYAEYDTGATTGADFDEVYQDEFTYSMSGDDELMDWVRNNMNWEDLEADAFLVKNPPVTPHKIQWSKLSSNGESLKIVSVEVDS